MKTSISLLLVLCAGILPTRAQTMLTDNSGGLYEGMYERRNNQGVTEATYEVSQGKLNGEAVFYYPGGQIREKGFFEAGKRHGIWNSYGTNGKITSRVQFKHGKKHGTWLLWDEQGVLRYEMRYRNGEKTGTWKIWDANGNLLEKKKF